VAERRPHVLSDQGVERGDAYYWMRDRGDPALLPYIEAENAYTEAMTAHLEGLRGSLFDEMLARIDEDDSSAPVPWGGFVYYQRTERGRDYPLHCRRPAAASEEQVLLDESAEAEGHDYFYAGHFDVDDGHRLLAWSSDVDGSEIYTIRFRDLQTGEDLPDRVTGAYYSSAWAADSKSFFYVTIDEAHRPWQVWRHTLGTAQSEDTLVYQEDDERFLAEVRRSRSGGFVILELQSAVTSEVRVLPAAEPTSEPVVLQPRMQGVEYRVAHREDDWWIVTNRGDATTFELVRAPLASPGVDAWETVVDAEPQTTLLRVEAFADHLVVEERTDGLIRFRVLVPEVSEHHVEMPESTWEAWTGENPEYDADVFRFGYSSMVTPESVFEWSIAEQARVLVDQDEVLGGYQPDRYVTRRLAAVASDGTEVPVSVVHRRDTELPAPTWLTAYGAYGTPYDPYFSAERLSLLDRGMVYAIAHVRGGGDLGRTWYEDGKLLRKKNTFTDFLAVAEHLRAQGVADRLAIQGESAGGLLIGAVLNLRPELFTVAVADVPFVDALTTMLDASIPLTATEWEEWGSPAEQEYFDYIGSYSPYDNVAVADYPHLLITSGLNDPRVQYWEPTKWAARLRHRKTDANLLLLRTNMGAGHGGESGRRGRLRDYAFVYSFVLDRLELGGDEGGEVPSTTRE